MADKLETTSPYKIGDKIKVYLSDGEISAEKPTCTFGRVVSVDAKGHNPKLEYEDYSSLPLNKFNRLVMQKEVSFVKCAKDSLGYRIFKNDHGELKPA